MEKTVSSLTSFSWKRKAGKTLSQAASKAFAHVNEETEEFGPLPDDVNLDWRLLARPNKVMRLEDAVTKSQRLQSEGATLAESERYWEAIQKWDEAISFTPKLAKLHEMKAQSLLCLLENQPAVIAAQRAIDCEPTWWVAYQTLGRVHLSMGEVIMAVRDFLKAIHLNPLVRELWEEDLKWSLSLLRKKERNIEESQIDDKNVEACESETGQTSIIEEIQNYTQRDNESNSDQGDSSQRTETYDRLQTVPSGYVLMRDRI